MSGVIKSEIPHLGIRQVTLLHSDLIAYCDLIRAGLGVLYFSMLFAPERKQLRM